MIDIRCWNCTKGLPTLEYKGKGIFICPRCGDKQDCHDVIFTVTVKISNDGEGKIVEIIEPYDKRIIELTEEEKKQHYLTTKECIEEDAEFQELGKKREEGIYEFEFMAYDIKSHTDMGDEYDYEFGVISEKKIDE